MLSNGLAVLVEEGVAPGLDVLLVLGMILCPVVSHRLVETSVLLIGERLVHQAVATLGARRHCRNRLGRAILEHRPMQLTVGESDRLAIFFDLIGLGDGMLCGRLQSPHEAEISLELMGELASLTISDLDDVRFVTSNGIALRRRSAIKTGFPSPTISIR